MARSWRSARRAAGLVAAGAALSLAGCGGQPAPPEPVVTVQAATARRQPLERLVTAAAVLFPLHEAVLTPKISAPVERFFVARGDRVHRGELVVQLENADLAAAALEAQGALEQARAQYQTTTASGLPQQLAGAQSDLRSTRQAFDEAQQIYMSRQSLFQQGAIPRASLESARVTEVQAQAAYQAAEQSLQKLQAVGRQATLEAAQGALTAARGQAQAAQARLRYSQIRSPIDGVVTDRPAYPGELATATSPLMTVMDIARVVARAHVPQAQAALLRVGDAATVTVEAGLRVSGRVSVVSPALDPGSTTVQIWVEAANPGERLRPGAAVTVSIVVGVLPRALVVPSAAVLTATDGSTSVMVIGADGKAHTRAVRLGLRQGEEAQILSGLAPGERVVTTGAFGLDDGTKVRVEPAPAAGSADGDASGSGSQSGADPDGGPR